MKWLVDGNMNEVVCSWCSWSYIFCKHEERYSQYFRFADICKCAALLSKQGFEPRSPEMKASGITQLQYLTLSFVFNKML